MAVVLAATYNPLFFTGNYNALGVKASDDNSSTRGPTPPIMPAPRTGTGGLHRWRRHRRSGSNYTGSLSATAKRRS